MKEISFADPGVAAALEALNPAEIDHLPFGVIRLSSAGTVELFSRTEASLSGYGERRALGRDFFEVVAPCMNTAEFRARIERDASRGRVDFEHGHTGDFSDPARFVRMRICSASGGGYWLLLER